MTQKDEQLKQFRAAVNRKSDEAEEASHQRRFQRPGDEEGTEAQPSIVDAAHHQDQFSVRDKNSGKGKKTADKWNQ